MTAPFRILGIAGSLRAGSYNRLLLEAARDLAPAGVAVDLISLRTVEPFDGDVEAAGDPPGVAALKAAIRDADALIVSTPEYNGAVPGVLQNAIDWASRPRGDAPLTDKPIVVTSASPGLRGGARAHAALRQVLANAGARVVPGPILALGGVEVAFDADGRLLDGAAQADLAALLAALVEAGGFAAADKRRAA